jgi:hypothetical protein
LEKKARKLRKKRRKDSANHSTKGIIIVKALLLFDIPFSGDI